MGPFRVDGLVMHIVDRQKTATAPGLLVDTGSEDLQFVMANGRHITRSVGFAIVHVEGHFTIDEVVFAQDGDLTLLGGRALGGLNLAVDSRSKLVATGPLPVAATARRVP